jgi:hypothetical protein
MISMCACVGLLFRLYYYKETNKKDAPSGSIFLCRSQSFIFCQSEKKESKEKPQKQEGRKPKGKPKARTPEQRKQEGRKLKGRRWTKKSPTKRGRSLQRSKSRAVFQVRKRP